MEFIEYTKFYNSQYIDCPCRKCSKRDDCGPEDTCDECKKYFINNWVDPNKQTVNDLTSLADPCRCCDANECHLVDGNECDKKKEYDKEYKKFNSNHIDPNKQTRNDYSMIIEDTRDDKIEITNVPYGFVCEDTDKLYLKIRDKENCDMAVDLSDFSLHYNILFTKVKIVKSILKIYGGTNKMDMNDIITSIPRYYVKSKADYINDIKYFNPDYKDCPCRECDNMYKCKNECDECKKYFINNWVDPNKQVDDDNDDVMTIQDDRNEEKTMFLHLPYGAVFERDYKLYLKVKYLGTPAVLDLSDFTVDASLDGTVGNMSVRKVKAVLKLIK